MLEVGHSAVVRLFFIGDGVAEGCQICKSAGPTWSAQVGVLAGDFAVDFVSPRAFCVVHGAKLEPLNIAAFGIEWRDRLDATRGISQHRCLLRRLSCYSIVRPLGMWIETSSVHLPFFLRLNFVL